MSEPSWYYGPDGQADIFYTEKDVPEGWADHPAKVGGPPSKRGRPKKEAKADEGQLDIEGVLKIEDSEQF